MFNDDQIKRLNQALSSQSSIVLRRYRAENNEGIKHILEQEMNDIQNLQVFINNPKLVTK